MISLRVRVMLKLALVMAFAFFAAEVSFAEVAKSQVVSRELRSEKFSGNKIGTSPGRRMVVYLPAGYDSTTAR